MRLRLLVATVVAILAASSATAAQSPQEILDHARSVYSAMTSYADTGSVVQDYSPTSHDTHRFATSFNRTPRHFLFDFHKASGDRLVVWADPDAFHVWWKATGQTTEFPNPKNTGAIRPERLPDEQRHHEDCTAALREGRG